MYDAKVSLSSRSEGLFLLKKLSKEHLDLTSYSRMRVNLAVEVYRLNCFQHAIEISNLAVVHVMQVLSDTVAKALDFYGDSKTRETQRFVRNFDIFFDCLNVRHPTEYIRRRKPNLEPYTSKDDVRFNVCIYAVIK